MAAYDDRRETLMDLYRSFNLRDIDAVLLHLAPGFDWPNGMSGGREHGRDAVRSYWLRQWQEVDPRVEPLSIDMDAEGRAHVRVQQLVRSLDGQIITNRKVEHVYEFEGPFIKRMDIRPLTEEEDDEDDK
jgi:hypothetical protein